MELEEQLVALQNRIGELEAAMSDQAQLNQWYQAGVEKLLRDQPGAVEDEPPIEESPEQSDDPRDSPVDELVARDYASKPGFLNEVLLNGTGISSVDGTDTVTKYHTNFADDATGTTAPTAETLPATHLPQVVVSGKLDAALAGPATLGHVQQLQTENLKTYTDQYYTKDHHALDNLETYDDHKQYLALNGGVFRNTMLVDSYISDHSALMSMSPDLRELYDGAGTPALAASWNAGVVTGGAHGRALWDDSAVLSVAWNGRQLFGTSGTNCTHDFNARMATLADTSHETMAGSDHVNITNLDAWVNEIAGNLNTLLASLRTRCLMDEPAP